MTGDKCTIRIFSRQTMGKEADAYDEVYDGTFLTRGNRKYISYDRTSDDGVINVLVSFCDTDAALTQHGAVESKIAYIPGQKTFNKYALAEGTFNVVVETFDVSSSATEYGHRLLLEYQMELAGTVIRTSMEIKIELQ